MLMKLTLHFFLIFIIGFKTCAQTDQPNKNELQLYNLFYLSKYVTADNLSPEQINQVYNTLINAIEPENAAKLAANYIPAAKDSIERDPIGAFLSNRKIQREQLKNTIISEFMVGTFKIISDEIKPLKAHFDNLLTEEKLKILLENKIILDTLKKNIEDRDTLKIKQFNNKLNLLNSNEKLILTRDEVQAAIKENEKQINENANKKAEYIKKVENYAENYIKKSGITYSDIKFFYSNDVSTATTEIRLNSIIQSAEQRAGTNSFSLPNESDMIKAVAIFLAKRAQQEAAIWFMDQLRNNLKNPLVYEAFPETIKLIESLEDYKTPNFSTAWRYAISSDFVKMPKNLAGSNWVKNIVFDNNEEKAACFSTSVNFGYDLNRLISEKYNYRDIIRFFYTNPDFDYNSSASDAVKNNTAKQLLSESISILYILTNEFFAIDSQEEKENFRLLSYEEISSLNQSQWIALGQLIKIKYGTKFGNSKIFFEKEYMENQKNLSKWMGNLLITLSQFDKVNKDFQKTLDNKNDVSNYNFYNVWQITSQIIENLDYKKYLAPNLSNIIDQTNKFDITIIKDCLEVYNNIQNKNFATGIQKTMSIIEKISAYTNKFVLHEFYIKDTRIEFTKDGLCFTNKGKIYSLKPTFSGNKLELSCEKCMVENYTKVQPFLRFIDNIDKDENYQIIKTISPTFEDNLSNIATQLNLEKTTVLELLKLLSLYDGAGYSPDKIAVFLKTSENIYRLNKKTTQDLEGIKYKYQDQLFKLTSFFGDVLVAKNEQELANVIDSHALPPTSYKLKRKVAHSIDLNAYVGLQGSRLIPNGYSTLEQQYTAGITAPIGFAFTWSTKGPKADNFGFTIDVVDLGNIVNHYLVSSDEDYPTDVHFSEVFSPAFSGMYSLRKTPFVVFGSIKFLPLKTSKSETGELINNKTFDATVFSIGVKIDIPLVNLWTRVQ